MGRYRNGYVYILSNKYHTALYIGVTTDLILRISQHKNKQGSAFTSKYKLEKLLYFEQFDNVLLAIEREKYLKGKGQKYKWELIKSMNPKLIDLYSHFIST